MNWVNDYLLRAKPLRCTAIDLYAARCGLLHTFSPDSRLSYEGNARRICYSWGSASVQAMHRTIDLTNSANEFVAVHVDDLYEGWRLGLLAFAEELERDQVRKASVDAKASRFFDAIRLATLREVLDTFDGGSAN